MSKDTESESKKKHKKHDGFFKRTFGDLESARELLEEFLPKKILEIIDLTTLRTGGETFVEQNLQRNFTDILYSVKMKDAKDGDLFIILEHQSSVSYNLTDRIWKYTHLICEKHKYKDGKYPLILPLIIYNGKEKYTAPRNFFKKFRKSKLALELFSDTWPLGNLNEMKEEELNYNSKNIIPIYFMKYVHEKDRVVLVHNFIEGKGKDAILKDKKNDYKNLKNMLYYYMDSKMSEEEQYLLNETLINLLPNNDGEEMMQTVADIYRNEGKKIWLMKGIEKGRKEGMEKEAIKVATKMLKDGEPIEKIAKYAGLSKDEILELHKKLEKELET